MATIRSYFMARYYDTVMKKTEQRFLGEWRAKLLGSLKGEVLEVGSGTGVNLQYYPASVTRLLLTEPDTNMRKQLQRTVEETDKENITTSDFVAESIPCPDGSFDNVVSTLVLCSVVDQRKCLQEFRRVLRPGGKLVFLEHVVSKENPKLRRWQNLLQPLWKYIGCNCHLTRDTEKMIRDAGFNPLSIEHMTMEGVPPVVRPVIKGVAQRT